MSQNGLVLFYLSASPTTEVDSRIGVSVQAQEVDLGLRGACRMACIGSLKGAFTVQSQSGTIGILIGVKEDVRSIIFVVTDSLAGIAAWKNWVTYSLAQR